jgi:hypothetical protein
MRAFLVFIPALVSIDHGLDMPQATANQTASLLMGCQCCPILMLCNRLPHRIPTDNIPRGLRSPIVLDSTMQIVTSSVKAEDRWVIASGELHGLNKHAINVAREKQSAMKVDRLVAIARRAMSSVYTRMCPPTSMNEQHSYCWKDFSKLTTN